MRVEDLAQAFRVRGHRVRAQGGEVKLQECVFCSNPRYNLEVSASKGVYHCWACDKGGTARDLLEMVGATPPPDLEVRLDAGDRRRGSSGDSWPSGTYPATENAPALAYLESRGVSEAESSWLDLGVAAGPRIVFPLREYWEGTPVGHVSRGFAGAAGPRYMTDVACPDSLPGWRSPTPGQEVHVVVEGVFDGLAVRRSGYGAAVLLGIGRRDSAIRWASRVPKDHAVAVALDASAAREAQALLWTLKEVHDRVSILHLPGGSDPASLGHERVGKLIGDTVI